MPGILKSLVESEINSFAGAEGRWRPTYLFTDVQARFFMADMRRKFKTLVDAHGELSSLERSDQYLRFTRSMGFNLKRAEFARNSNHVSFAMSVSRFYTDYATILRFLKFDLARGKLSGNTV